MSERKAPLGRVAIFLHQPRRHTHRLCDVRVGAAFGAVAALDSSPDLDGENPIWRPWLSLLTRKNTLVRHDHRGCEPFTYIAGTLANTRIGGCLGFLAGTSGCTPRIGPPRRNPPTSLLRVQQPISKQTLSTHFLSAFQRNAFERFRHFPDLI
jgi:hypothetical protein